MGEPPAHPSRAAVHEEARHRAEHLAYTRFSNPRRRPEFIPPPTTTGDMAMSSIEDVDGAIAYLSEMSAQVMDAITALGTAATTTGEVPDALGEVTEWADAALKAAVTFGMPTARTEEARAAVESLQQEIEPIAGEVREAQGKLSRFRHRITDVQELVAAISQE